MIFVNISCQSRRLITRKISGSWRRIPSDLAANTLGPYSAQKGKKRGKKQMHPDPFLPSLISSYDFKHNEHFQIVNLIVRTCSRLIWPSQSWKSVSRTSPSKTGARSSLRSSHPRVHPHWTFLWPGSCCSTVGWTSPWSTPSWWPSRSTSTSSWLSLDASISPPPSRAWWGWHSNDNDNNGDIYVMAYSQNWLLCIITGFYT